MPSTFWRASDCGGGNCSGCAGGISTWKPGTLEVVQTLQRVGGALCFVPPKTDDSERTIPLPELCVQALKDRERLETERAHAGVDRQEHGLIFPSRIGTPMKPDNLRRSWGRIRTAVGLDEVRLVGGGGCEAPRVALDQL